MANVALATHRQVIEAMIANRLTTRHVAACLTATAGTDAATGKPTLTWEFDQAALDAGAATDGWYALLANLDHTEAGAAGVLQRFKGQEASERRVCGRSASR